MTPASQSTLCHPGSIAPGAAVVMALLLCGGGLFFLVPDRNELFKRHLADGDAEAASLLLDREGGNDSNRITAALAAEALAMCERDSWKDSTLAMVTGYLRATKNFMPAAEEILRRADTIPTNPRVKILGAVVERAIGEGELEFAETVQMRLVDAADVLTPDLVRQAVKTYRYNNNPELALHTIDQLAKAGRPLPSDLSELRVTLALGASQPGLAFALLEKRIRLTDDPEVLKKLIPEAVNTGVQAGRQGRLIPLYERYLSIVPAPDGKGRDPLRDEFAGRLAQTYEWTGQPAEAFEVYLRLAAEGDRKALDRCIALNPGLFRTGDLLDTLTAAYSHYRDDDELRFMTARLLAEAARREEAIRLFLEFLEQNPDHAEAHFRLALVFDEAQIFDRALTHYERAHALDPKNTKCLERIIKLSVNQGKYERCIGLYRELIRQTLDREQADEFYTLASSLGDLEASKEALRLMIKIGGPNTPGHRVTLASIYRSSGDNASASKVLEEALQAHPRDSLIQLELAETYLLQKRPDRALKLLRSTSFKRHPYAAHVVLSALSAYSSVPGLGSPTANLARFGGQLEACDDLVPAEVLQLADLFLANGEPGRATKLFRQVVRESESPGDLARAHYQLGDGQSALRCQLQYLRQAPRPGPEDYRLLGDIYSQLKQKDKAQGAYREALDLLKRRTVSP